MGAKDTITTKHMQRNEIFADAFNYYVYDGRQVIDPNSLEELDTREIIYFRPKAWDGPLNRQWTCWTSLKVIVKRLHQKNGRKPTIRPAKIATSGVASQSYFVRSYGSDLGKNVEN